MSVDVVAKKDVRDAVRSYWLWGLAVLFSGLLAVTPLLIVAGLIQIDVSEQGAPVTTDLFVRLIVEVTAFVVPVMAVILSYGTIASERDAGTLKLLMALPHSRLDVVVGKTIGRGAVVLIALLVGFVVTAIAFLPTPIEFVADTYVVFAFLTGLLGLAFVGISVGASAAAETARRAMIATVTLFVLFALVWSRFASGLISLLSDNTDLGGDVLVPLHLFVRVLNPIDAYKSLVFSMLRESPLGGRVALVGGGGIQGQLNRQLYVNAMEGNLPVYLTDPVLVVILVSWAVAVPLVGYWVFGEADL